MIVRYSKEDIEPQKLDIFLSDIREMLLCGFMPLAFFGTDEKLLYSLMGKNGDLRLICCQFPNPFHYPSLSVEFPCFNTFERELHQQYGIVPINHPWLKNVRHNHQGSQEIEDYPFLRSKSKLIHEVGVGPVHAGVIEPGHFRFLMRGEIIEHLEIQLGYQYRGMSQLLCKGNLAHKMSLAECIAGDTVIGHGTAYCQIVESLSNTQSQAHDIRILLLEMERVAMHLSTLSSLAGDVAYIMGQNIFAAIRTFVINSTLSICGSRFGKRALCPGGVNYGLNSDQITRLSSEFEKYTRHIQNTSEALFSTTSLLSRFDDTGKLHTNDALRFGFTGISAKASGVPVDARTDYPDWQYPGFLVQTEISGDVYARAHLRYLEIMQSLQIILALLPTIKPHAPLLEPPSKLEPGKIAISIIESARGRIVHIAKSKDEYSALWYKVIDPSFVNWQALSLSVVGEQISDFPLCNKSFDLSYCGSDL